MGVNLPVKDTAEAVKGICEAVPLYQDVAQPALQEVGKTLGGATRLALSPLNGLIWGFDQSVKWLGPIIDEKLNKRGVSKEQVIQPDISVSGPIIEAMRFTVNQPDLREMYANLLATAMDPMTSQNALPVFIEFIKQITSDEARYLQALFHRDNNGIPFIEIHDVVRTQEFHAHSVIYPAITPCRLQNEHLLNSYVNNLCRMGILVIPHEQEFNAPDDYQAMKSSKYFFELAEEIEAEGKQVKVVNKCLVFTQLGRHFMRSCLSEDLPIEVKAPSAKS